jgi:predicted transcriptional regulator
MDEDKSISVRMDMKTVKALEKIGVELDRSISWLVRKAAEEYIERYQPPKK